MRTDSNLKYHYHAILSYIGLNFLLIGLLIFTPLLALLAWHDEWIYSPGFIVPAVVLSSIGFVIWKVFRSRRAVTLTVQDGGIVVLFSWIVAFLSSAIPFMAIIRLNFTQAVFEAVSGWTTTGLSVVDVANAPNAILLWRSIMQLVGGAGFAIIMLATITGPVGPGVSIAEGRTDQLAPHIRRSVKLVATIYGGYAIFGIISYQLAGMSFFDAINHSFAAISTGGFSTKPENIGHWDSPAVEAVSIILMIFGNMNFLTAYMLLSGRFKAFYRNGEVKTMAVLIPLCAVILIFLVCNSIYLTTGKVFRVALFEVVTCLTTTGFTSTVYANWNSLGYLVLTLLMLVGGGTCSTAGGIKQYRIYILFKSFIWDLKRPFLPKQAIVENHVWKGEWKEFVTSEHIRQVGTFVFLYLCLYFLGSGIIATHGYKLNESLFEFASAMGTVGSSCGLTAAASPKLVLWTEVIGMFLGRLEFFVIFVSIGKIVRDAFSISKPAPLRRM